MRRLPLMAIWLCIAPAPLAAQELILADGFDQLSCPGASGNQIVAVVGASLQTALLGNVRQFPVEVRSCGYQGSVSLSLSGVPVSWSAQLDAPSFTLAVDETREGTLTVSIPSNGTAGLVDIGVVVQAGAGGSVNLTARLDVANEYLVTIPSDASATNHQLPTALFLRVGTRLRIRNADNEDHALHFDNTVGIPHMPVGVPFTLGQEYSAVVTQFGTDRMYCHVHGPAIAQANIIVN